jgi:hypothetical protein
MGRWHAGAGADVFPAGIVPTPCPPTQAHVDPVSTVVIARLADRGAVAIPWRRYTLKRFRLALPQGLEALSVHGKWRAASWTGDLGLRFELTKPFVERVVALRARNRELRVA